MSDLYHIDLEQFSLERFRHMLEAKDVLPGRRVLKEKMPERFAMLASMGIRNLKELREVLKTKARREKLAQESRLPIEYLVILGREVNSYISKPFNLKDIPEVNPEYIEKLASVGIKHTKHLFQRARSKSDRAKLSELVGVPGDALLELVKLSDLARIVGVGPVFARLLYELGADTPEAFLKRSPDELLEELHAVNDEKGYTRIMPTVKDIEYCFETARYLPRAVEYS